MIPAKSASGLWGWTVACSGLRTTYFRACPTIFSVVWCENWWTSSPPLSLSFSLILAEPFPSYVCSIFKRIFCSCHLFSTHTVTSLIQVQTALVPVNPTNPYSVLLCSGVRRALPPLFSLPFSDALHHSPVPLLLDQLKSQPYLPFPSCKMGFWRREVSPVFWVSVR